MTQVNIGAGQSTFSHSLEQFAKVLDIVGRNGLVLLDDATEGTDPDNSRDYMRFVIETLQARGAISYFATQQRELYRDGISRAAFYSTVPGSYGIKQLDGIEEPERVGWRDVARGTRLEPFLGK